MARSVVMLQHSSADGPGIMASRKDAMLVSSTIPGIDLAKGRLGTTPEEQFDLAFDNAGALLRRAGLSPSDVGLLTVFIPDASYRSYINKPWLQMFPDDADRPARKTTHTPLATGSFVQLQIVAVAGGGRRSVAVPGLVHRDPLPVGVRVGDLIFSSVVVPDDPATGARGEGKAQIAQAYRNLRAIVEAGGGTLDDVVQVWVYLGDWSYQKATVETWLEVFPLEGDRPSRKTFQYELGGSNIIQLQFVAAIGGRRANFEVPGIGHEDPIPLGASKAGFFYSSGITGVEPGAGKLADGAEAQAVQALRNTQALVEIAGGAMSDLTAVHMLVGDLSLQPAVMNALRQSFPQETDRPALHIMKLGLPGRATLVQVHAAGVF